MVTRGPGCLRHSADDAELRHALLASLVTGSVVMLAIAAWQMRRGREPELFRPVARIALKVLAPAVLLAMMVGSHLGVVEAVYQQRAPGAAARPRPRRLVATGVAVLATVLSLFAGLYPRVVVASTGSANDLTVAGTASGTTTLTAMAIATAVLFPLVLLDQGWEYTVFHERVQRATQPPAVPRGRRAVPPAAGLSAPVGRTDGSD